jgi:hypothetical protein
LLDLKKSKPREFMLTIMDGKTERTTEATKKARRTLKAVSANHQKVKETWESELFPAGA